MQGDFYLSYPPSDTDIEAGVLHGTPNPAQEAWEALGFFLCVLIAGFGTGKTTALARACLKAMFENPGSSGMIIAPTYRHTELILQAIEEMLERSRAETGVNMVEHITRSKGQSRIVLTNGSNADLYTAGSRTSFFGPSKTWIAIDEWEWCADPDTMLDSCVHRLRERTMPGIRTVNYHRIFITSTAQTVSGPLRKMIDKAKEQQRKAQSDEEYVPDTGVVVAPSTCAIGFGLDREKIKKWKDFMDSRTFARAVACDLSPPPEVMYADYVSEENIVSHAFDRNLKTYFFFDWGVHHSALVVAQYVPARNGLVVLREWAPGPEEPARVGDVIREAVKVAYSYGLTDAQGRILRRGALQCIGDPTPDPKQYTKRADEKDVLVIEGVTLLQRLGWSYRAPLHPRQRSKQNQVTLFRSLLGGVSKGGKKWPPRVFFVREIAMDSEAFTPESFTKRGLWSGMSYGLKYAKDARGQVIEKIDKSTGYDHLHDALLYGLVMVFSKEFDELLHQEFGLLSGATAWEGR